MGIMDAGQVPHEQRMSASQSPIATMLGKAHKASYCKPTIQLLSTAREASGKAAPSVKEAWRTVGSWFVAVAPS